MQPKTLLISFLVLLIAAIGFVIHSQTRVIAPTFHDKLADLLPPPPEGWTRIEQPIAETPEMRQKVDELLNFDDGVFYIYTSGATRLSVYIAYWMPGKMSSRLVAGHSPDICWVAGGWKCTARSLADDISVDGIRLPEAEARTFTSNGNTEYVWFWHLVDGRRKAYSSDGKIPWHAIFTDIRQSGFNQSHEQFFIRLSSPQPLNDPLVKPALNAVLRTLPLRRGLSMN